MSRHSQLTKYLLILALLLAPFSWQIARVEAAALTNRKDTLQTSAHSTGTGVLSQHTFQFTTATALTTDSSSTADFSVVFNFPTNASGDAFGTSVPNFTSSDSSITATSCGSRTFTATDIGETNNAGHSANDEFQILVNNTQQDGTNVPSGCVLTVTLGQSSGAQRLTNPTEDQANSGCTVDSGAGDADICSITIATTEDTTTTATPTAVDNGDVLVALLTGTTVSVTVDESLTFTVVGLASGSCTGDTGSPTTVATTATTVPFGTVSSGAFYAGCQQLSVTTNAVAGYNLTGEENTSLQKTGSVEIPDTSCDTGPCTATSGQAWATNTNYGFGQFCETVTGAACDAAGDTTSEYRRFACRGAAADCTPANGVTPVTLMTDSAPTSNDSSKIHYKINVDPTQQPGAYSNTVTYIATPTF